jgi:predicted dehydrogenase
MNKGIDRRQFLKASIAAAIAPSIISGCARTQTGMARPAPSERITMGCIGLGWQGPGNMGEFLRIPEVQVVALCDVDQKHLADAKKTVDRHYENSDCATYNNFEDLLARGDLDTVMIALPDHWHAIPAIAAAEAGIDIYGEKPLSHTLAEGRAMVSAVERNGRIWQTGSWQRSVDNFQHAAQLVRNGRIGKVQYVEVGLGGGYDDYTGLGDQRDYRDPPAELDYERWVGPAPMLPYCPARTHKNWRWHMTFGGGRIMDWVGHHLDIAHWGLGLDYTGPVRVEGTGVIPEDPIWNAPPSYDCTCTYADGLVIRISDKYPMGAKWVGDQGWIFVTRGETQADPATVLDEQIGPDEIQLYKSTNHFENFIHCVKTREETITPCEIAHRSASVGHLCNIAIYTGRPITWNPETEEIVGDPEASAMLSPEYRAPWELG